MYARNGRHTWCMQECPCWVIIPVVCEKNFTERRKTAETMQNDPGILCCERNYSNEGVTKNDLDRHRERSSRQYANCNLQKPLQPQNLILLQYSNHVFVPTPVTEEKGERAPAATEKDIDGGCCIVCHPGDNGRTSRSDFIRTGCRQKIGGVFREAATLAEQFGDHRVFNTAIQEAYIIGSTDGYECSWCKADR